MAFEAYLEAKRSSNTQVRAKLPEFLRSYRESYAEFLKKTREDNLVDPKKPKNPARLYRDTYNSKNETPISLRKLASASQKEAVKDMIRNGATPQEIKNYIKNSLPQSRSQSITSGNTTNPQTITNSGSTNSVSNVSTTTPADPYASTSSQDQDSTYIGVPWN